MTYNIFKEVFEFVPYLALLPERLRIVFIPFRQGNTKLTIETGRWVNIDKMKGTVFCIIGMRLR